MEIENRKRISRNKFYCRNLSLSHILINYSNNCTSRIFTNNIYFRIHVGPDQKYSCVLLKRRAKSTHNKIRGLEVQYQITTSMV
jgi:hypothetical protein